MSDMFAGNFQKLESALIARERVQSIRSSNIANADTPNYRADTRTFEDFLAQQQMQLGNSSTKAAVTHPMHFSDSGSSQWQSTFRSVDHSTRKMDGNTVDPQKEMALLGENQLMHELTIRLMKGKLGGILNAIKEGNR